MVYLSRNNIFVMKARKIYIVATFLFIGFAAGIITGVVIDADQVYHTTVKRIKQKNSSGEISIDIDPVEKTKREIRKERREERREQRKERRQK